MKYQIDSVKIYSKDGIVVDEVTLPETIMPIPTKRGGFSKTGIYYKGCGVVYRNHLGNEVAEEDRKYVKCLGKTGVPYEKLILCDERFVGKHGIFPFRHQPVFSDHEGGCGPKEEKIIINQSSFELSAIEDITEVIRISIPGVVEKHSIYSYRMRNIKGNIIDTIRLIEYVLANNWNTAWDKNLWSDIVAYGYVCDIADWFVSDEPKHKLGTVYALLNSLYKADIKLYAQLLLMCFGEYDFERKNIILYSALIIEKFDKSEENNMIIQYAKEWNEQGIKLLLNELVSGKACCHLEDDDRWSMIRNYYKEQYIITRKGEK